MLQQQLSIPSLTSTSNGLSVEQAESRLRLYGPNKVKGAEGLSLWAILLRQVSNSLTLVSAFLDSRSSQHGSHSEDLTCNP